MEFWGEEVKPGATVSCKLDECYDYVIHFSQAALGETKKASENVILSVKIDNKEIVLGTLSVEKHPHMSCDLIFDKDFELSHTSKTASVFVSGYKSPVPLLQSDFEELETDQVPMHNKKLETSTAKVPLKAVMKVESSSDDDDDFTDSESDSEMSDDDDSSDEDELSSGADPSDDSGSEEQTPTPKKTDVVVAKKRAIEAEAPSGKKAKSEQSAQKTGDVSTHSASKTPAAKSTKTATADKKSPKSGGHACKSCNKSFSSASGLESHQKAKKHEA